MRQKEKKDVSLASLPWDHEQMYFLWFQEENLQYKYILDIQ